MRKERGGVKLNGLCVRYCIRNNGGLEKKLELPYATLIFNEQGIGEFIRGPMREVYDVQNMKIFSFLYENARCI